MSFITIMLLPMQSALQELKLAYSPKELRAVIIGNGEGYPQSQMIEDVARIYELAGMYKPTLEEINLDVIPDETRRVSLAGGAATKEDKLKHVKDVASSEAALLSSAAGKLKKDLESKAHDAKDTVTTGLKKLVHGSSPKESVDEEPMSQEVLDSLLALQSNEKPDLPKMLRKIKKRGDILPVLSFCDDPKVRFDDYSLTGITAAGGVPNLHPDLITKPSETKEDRNEIVNEIEHKGSKVDSLFDEFSSRIDKNVVLDNDTYTDVGLAGQKVNVHVPDASSQLNGDVTAGKHGYRITIIRAYSREPSDNTAHVDEVLSKMTEEDRMKYRSHVTIIRAYSRDAYGVQA